MERGSGTEHDATEGSSLTRVASGSFVTNEPLLVPVEGVVKSAFGGVKPATDILATAEAEDNTPNYAGARLMAEVPTATLR